MLELPEALTLARQIRQHLSGRRIESVVAAASPHRFAWFAGEPEAYESLFSGRTLTGAEAFGGMVEIHADDTWLVLGDGVNIRWYQDMEQVPVKHQLLLGLDDGSALVCSVQMYGGLWAFPVGTFDNPYYLVAKEKISPLSNDYDISTFRALFDARSVRLTAKAFLATEQRIPGLGNGVLQDILFHAGVHPRKKMDQLDDGQISHLFESLKVTLRRMTDQDGRNTEKDLFGEPGGYQTLMSSRTCGRPCPSCQAIIQRQAFMGGNVYFCPVCQPL